MWAKFDCNGADAYATKSLTLGSGYWFQADIWIPSTTLTACDDGDLFGFSALIMALRRISPFALVEFIDLDDSSYPSGAWEWSTGHGGTISLTADTSHTVKVHVGGGTATWYVDGAMLASGATTIPANEIVVGGLAADDCVCEWYFLTNVKVGTSDGGTDIFSDDFSGGDFTNWTSTAGSCTVVSAPADCVSVAAISADPTSACTGDTITITGSGFAASSALTVTIAGIPVTFSEATTDGSGNVSGTFVIPFGVQACGGCTASVVVTDGASTTASFLLSACCNKAADTLNSTSLCGPDFTPTYGSVSPLDYIHHDGAHWIVLLNHTSDPTIFTNCLDARDFKPLTVVRVSDDCSTVNSFDLDLEPSWTFAKPANAKTFVTNCACPPDTCATCPHQPIWTTITWKESWAKPVHDAQFASDGTTIWLAVLTEETIEYPHLSNKEGVHCIDGQLAQHLSLDDIGCSRAAGLVTQIAWTIGIPNDACYPCGFPTSDGGDSFSGYWSPPNVVMFAGDIGGFARLGSMNAEFCPGINNCVPPTCDDTISTAFEGSFFSGVSVAASSNQAGICHLVWSEGGDNGEVGLGASCTDCAPTVFDAGPAHRSYRVGYSTWDTGTKLTETDLFSSSADRTGGWPYTWPAEASFAASNVFQVRNDTGSPVLFIAAAQTTADGGDYIPWYPNPELDAYDLSSGSAVFSQSLGPALLPTELGAVGSIFATFLPGFNPLAALAISNLYTDATLSSTDVYLPVVEFGDSSLLGSAFYRIPADLSATFDYMDGTRLVGYSILGSALYGEMTGGIRRFFSEPNNVWMDPANGPWGLDRQCSDTWIHYFGIAGFTAPDKLFFDGDHSLYKVGNYGSAHYAVTAINICRGCLSCSCGSSGLHVWERV